MGKIKTGNGQGTSRSWTKPQLPLSERMKDALSAPRIQCENLSDDGQVSPTEYAEDKDSIRGQDVAEDHRTRRSSGTKKAVNKGKEATGSIVRSKKQQSRR